MRARAASIVAALGLVLVTGCGDDKKSTDTGGDDRLSKAEFVAQANAVCTTELARIDDSAFEPTDVAAVQKFFGEALTVVDQLIVKLRVLKPPAEDQAAFTKVLDQAVADNVEIRAELKDVKSLDDVAKIDFETSEEAINKAFDDLGLTKCGSDSES